MTDVIQNVRVDVPDTTVVTHQVSLHSRLSLRGVGPCDSKQVATRTEVQRVLAHQRGWEKMLHDHDVSAPLLYVAEDGRWPAIPSIIVSWLLVGFCDVYIPHTPPDRHRYVLTRAVLHRLLRLTQPVEMHMQAMWVVLDDLGYIHVQWAAGRPLSTIPREPLAWHLWQRNAKSVIPTDMRVAYIWFALFVVFIVVVCVRAH